jgi:hypothetical protein
LNGTRLARLEFGPQTEDLLNTIDRAPAWLAVGLANAEKTPQNDAF